MSSGTVVLAVLGRGGGEDKGMEKFLKGSANDGLSCILMHKVAIRVPFMRQRKAGFESPFFGSPLKNSESGDPLG